MNAGKSFEDETMTSPWILQTVSAITIFRQANMAVIARNTVLFITCYVGVGKDMLFLYTHDQVQ